MNDTPAPRRPIPRKGVTHTLNDLLGELADVALAALCAIEHFTRDAERAGRGSGLVLESGVAGR